jgi:hypothetical protein
MEVALRRSTTEMTAIAATKITMTITLSLIRNFIKTSLFVAEIQINTGICKEKQGG